LIDSLVKEINNSYVFPDMAKKVDATLREQQKRAVYDNMTSAQQLSEALTRELQATTRDRHLRVTYSEQVIPESKPAAKPSPDEAARRLAMMRSSNFGVEKIEHLPFNIGYLDLVGFASAKDAAATIAAAMTVIAHTDALIIDLRNNGGGDAAAVAQLASYLLDKRTRLNDFYYREGNRLEQRWSLDAVPGLRYGQKKDVYILTSKDTFRQPKILPTHSRTSSARQWSARRPVVAPILATINGCCRTFPYSCPWAVRSARSRNRIGKVSA
jgi:hypothetical protein